MNPTDHYLVDVIGFNDVERAMLASIFALAARRDPGFAQFEPNTTGRGPDLYLVDAEQPAAFNEFRALHKRAPLPTVLIGSTDHGTGLLALPRPLQWARLLQAFDDLVSGGEVPIAPAVDPMRRSIPGRSMPGVVLGRSNSPAAVPDPAASRKMMGDTVLVVDDNATVRAFMQAKLAPFQFDVDFAETGEEAIGLSGTHDYTCVFLDVVLPGIDGYQVCKLIKNNKQAIKKTSVVMLTSRSSPFDKLRGSLAGCDEYLTKPLDEDRLLEVIAKFLPSGRKQAEKAARK